MISRALLVTSLLIPLASCSSPRPTKDAIETRLAVDGSATFAGDVERVRGATTAALRKLGYDVDDSLITKPRTEKVGRWRWARATNPEAATAATVGAALSQGVVPTDASEPQGTPTDTEIAVSYAFELVADDAGSTTVVVRPRASLEGDDVTDEYLAVVGTDAARRRFEEIFDAIRAELAAPAPDAPSPAPR